MSDKLTEETRQKVSGLLHDLKAKTLRSRGGEITPEMQGVINEIAEFCSLDIGLALEMLNGIKYPDEFLERYDMGFQHSHVYNNRPKLAIKDEFGYDADDKIAFRELCADVALLKERQKKMAELLSSLATIFYDVYVVGDKRNAGGKLGVAYNAINDFANEIARENEGDSDEK